MAALLLWPFVLWDDYGGSFRGGAFDGRVYAVGHDGAWNSQAVALSQEGELLWRQVLPPENSQCSFMGAGGGLLVGGWDGPYGQGNLLYAKFSPDGTLLAADTFDLSPSSDDYLMEVDAGALLVGAGVQFYPASSSADAFVEARDTSDLSFLWRVVIDRADDERATDASLAGKWVWVSGYEMKPAGLSYRGVVHLLEASGNLLWSTPLDFFSNQTTKLYAAAGGEDGVWVAGYAALDQVVGFVAHLDTLGEVLSWDTIEASGDLRLYGVALSSDGSLFVAGTLRDTASHAYAARLAQDGTLLWEAVYPEASSADGAALSPGDTLYLFGDLRGYPAVFKVGPQGDFMGLSQGKEEPRLTVLSGPGWLRVMGPQGKAVRVYDGAGRLLAKGTCPVEFRLKRGVYHILGSGARTAVLVP